MARVVRLHQPAPIFGGMVQKVRHDEDPVWVMVRRVVSVPDNWVKLWLAACEKHATPTNFKIGVWYNGITGLSKSFNVGSIPTAPANFNRLRPRVQSRKRPVRYWSTRMWNSFTNLPILLGSFKLQDTQCFVSSEPPEKCWRNPNPLHQFNGSIK